MRSQGTSSHGARPGARKPPLVNRLARIAFTFVVMNYSAVVAAIAAMSGRKVWR